MLDALSQGMIPLGILNQPLTFKYTVDTPFGFTNHELTLDVPDLSLDLAVLSRFASSIWASVFGSALCNTVGSSICTIVNWKTSGSILLTVPLIGAQGRQSGPSGNAKQSGVLVLHTGHGDSYARRRIYFPGMPRRWQFDGLLNGTGQTQLYRTVATWYMAFKGSALPNPYRWLIAYPRVVEAGTGNFFGVAFRQPEYFRICNHCGKPPEGAALDWP